MCSHGDDVLVRVNIPAELSHTGAARWDVKGVDRCIAPIVEALNAHGILTAASCCGHGQHDGSIVLQDGRELTLAREYWCGRCFERPTSQRAKALGLRLCAECLP